MIKHNTWVKASALIVLSILTVVAVFCAGMLAIIAAPTMSGYYTGSSLYHVMYRFYPYTDAFITAVVICTNGETRLLLLAVDLLIAIAVGVFIWRTIEHPAHDVTVDPPPGSDAYRRLMEEKERQAAEAKEDEA